MYVVCSYNIVFEADYGFCEAVFSIHGFALFEGVRKLKSLLLPWTHSSNLKF